MQNTLMGNALADRGDGGQCNMPRIPTGRYPAFSTTFGGTLDANGAGTVELQAPRDLLLIGLSVDIPDTAPLSASVDMAYCNTKYLVKSSARTWAVCCARKPVFLVGVREDKKLEFTVTGGTADAAFSITVHGFQGNGCCG